MTRRRRIRLMGVVVIVLLLPLAGCGTLHAVIAKSLRSDLKLAVTFHIAATGVFANLMSSQETPCEQLKAPPGSKIERYWKGQEFHWVASGIVEPASFQNMGISASKDDYWVVTYYHYRERMGRDKQGAAPDDPVASQMASAMVSIALDLGMPGKVIETNGSATDGGMIRWTPGLSQLDSSLEMYATSRSINVVPCGTVLLLILLPPGVIALRRRPAARTSLHVDPVEQASPAANAIPVVPVPATASSEDTAERSSEPAPDRPPEESAFDKLEASARSKSDIIDDWRELAKVCARSGNWVTAARCAQRIVMLVPESPSAWCDLGKAHRRLGQLPEAEAAQRRALKLRPGYRNAFEELFKIEQARYSSPGRHQQQ